MQTTRMQTVSFTAAVTRSFTFTSVITTEGMICGECEYCCMVAEHGIPAKELPGAIFCKSKQIEYETLNKLQCTTYPRYILNTGTVNVDSEKDEFSGFGFFEVKSKKESTMIIIPLILAEILQELRRAHEDELQNNEHFMSVVNHMNVKNVKLNAILDNLIHQDLVQERPGRISQIKAAGRLKSLNAFELFSLVIIFLNRLTSPIFRLSTDSCKTLLALSVELPRDANLIAEEKKSLVGSILEASWEKREQIKAIFDQIHQMFAVDDDTLKNNLVIKNSLFHVLRENLKSKTKLRIRRNMIRLIIRNAKFELNRHVCKLFHKRCDVTDSSRKKQRLMKGIFAQEAANLASCYGPVFLELSKKFDSRENRIKAMTSLLYHFDGSVMYTLEKSDLPFGKAMSCHLDCPCGFGKPENIHDPAFRNLYIGAPFLASNRRRLESPTKESPVTVKKYVIEKD